MRKTFSTIVWQEDEWFVAQCLEVDIASQGKTEKKALENLREALALHFTPPVATVYGEFKKLKLRLPREAFVFV
jgi:hypothetical protein